MTTPIPVLHQNQVKSSQSFRRFDAPLSVQSDAYIPKKYRRVTQAFRYYVNTADENRWVVVPAGYLTDGATVPWPVRELLPPWGPYGQAAVLHDWLCEYQCVIGPDGFERIGWAQIDTIFRHAMRILKVPYPTCQSMYLGTRFYSKCIRSWRGQNQKAYLDKRRLEQHWQRKMGYTADGTLPLTTQAVEKVVAKIQSQQATRLA